MRAAFDIARKDLRQKVRDRSAIFLAVLAPLGLAFLFSSMIPDQGTFHTTWVVVDLDGGPVAQALHEGPLKGMTDAGVVDVAAAPTEAEARQQVEDGAAAAAIVLPADFSERVQAGQATTITVIGGPSALSTEIARSVLVGYGRELSGVQVAVGSVVAASREHPDEATIARLARDALALPAPIAIGEGTTADREAGQKTYYGASMAILFVFFAAQFGVVGLLAERRTGTLARMLASPIAPSTILFGKVLVSLVLSAVSVGVVVLATTLLMGADWGDPVAVVALVLAAAIAATGIATLVVGFARTEEQAGGAIAIVAMTLAVLGGSFFPLSQAPEGLAALSVITPHAWFLRGVDDLAAGGGIATVATPVAILLAVGLLTGGIGLARARRVVVP